MELKTKYITADDYLQYFGVDLNAVLPDDDAPNGKAERFIKGVEDDVSLFLQEKCFRRIDDEYHLFSDHQKECYKLALLNQCKYKLRNGDIGNDSGYDPNTGEIIAASKLSNLVLSQKTISYLKNAGLYCRKLGGSRVGFFRTW